MAETSRTARHIHYYELEFKPLKRYKDDERHYLLVLKRIAGLVKKKDKSRYKRTSEYTLFIGDLKIDKSKSLVFGKLFKVRNDVFPQIINMDNEDIEDLETEENQGILETTHFIFDIRHKSKAQLAIEYNHYGGRASELVKYLSNLGRQQQIIRGITATPIIRDRLEAMVTRINRVSKFLVRVHKDNISRITNTDQGLASALYHSQNYSDSDYLTLDFKFDYRQRQETETIRESIFKWARKFVESPEEAHNFDVFKVEAEDEEKDNSLEEFDLLIDKEKSKVSVEKRPHSRVIVSSSMYEALVDEYQRKFQ